ncbi:hypothetical protein D3C77_594220 [compost metagenome]
MHPLDARISHSNIRSLSAHVRHVDQLNIILVHFERSDKFRGAVQSMITQEKPEFLVFAQIPHKEPLVLVRRLFWQPEALCIHCKKSFDYDLELDLELDLD